MVGRRRVVVVLLALTCVVGLGAQSPGDDEATWRAFMAWFRSAPPLRVNPFMAYAASLQAAGVPDAEAKREVAVLMQLLRERSDWVEVLYDKTFSVPPTGDPETDGFATEPSALLVGAVGDLPPGTALDAGMGQGRNAVFLARRGWTVTGFDLSAGAVTAASANASRAGVSIDAVKASYADFDFGTAKWDLVVMTFAWAPVDDPAFVARLRTSLRPGGRVVFEHFLQDPQNPRPPAMHALQPGQLRDLFTGFRLERYEELTDLGDWGGPGMHLVRMIAVTPL